MNNLFLLLMAPAEGQQGGSGWSMLIMLLLFFVILWLFMIRPQQKRAKQEQEARNAMQKGDKVVTIGGVHGKISEIQENTFLIEVADGVKIKIEKSAIAVNQLPAKKDESKK